LGLILAALKALPLKALSRESYQALSSPLTSGKQPILDLVVALELETANLSKPECFRKRNRRPLVGTLSDHG
jgi:hypothetical protein